MSNEQIAAACVKKVEMILLQHLPKPDCAVKKLKWEWDIMQVKKKVANELSPQGMSIKIEI
jgi:hypothetical protein